MISYADRYSEKGTQFLMCGAHGCIVMHNVTIYTHQSCRSSSAKKSSYPGNTVETLLPLQSFDPPTQQQSRLKTKVNTHTCRDINTHILQTLTVWWCVMRLSYTLFRQALAPAQVLQFLFSIIHVSCLQKCLNRKLGQRNKTFRCRSCWYICGCPAGQKGRPLTITCLTPNVCSSSVINVCVLSAESVLQHQSVPSTSGVSVCYYWSQKLNTSNLLDSQ